MSGFNEAGKVDIAAYKQALALAHDDIVILKNSLAIANDYARIITNVLLDVREQLVCGINRSDVVSYISGNLKGFDDERS